ncbi:hypothetical protein BD289DRAFT_438401 [Coniella lustricola]|uniref:Secreted protein n=1 Tax=Coniella lustricola TaxID=2025994 RepID=A0A2T3A309_9PEZI|nr:hypothetical protein BD289DRAFT_438401 [Coniella lustricola]
MQVTPVQKSMVVWALLYLAGGCASRSRRRNQRSDRNGARGVRKGGSRPEKEETKIVTAGWVTLSICTSTRQQAEKGNQMRAQNRLRERETWRSTHSDTHEPRMWPPLATGSWRL